ncbi:MAG: tRNA adenosine(34) deaminase TadA [Lachnospiraceae bacterium]|jgi:tRNA(adenine34) deaminase|nr:tRNA adenosine(34) deaminase TadA [Lachnospiraceae bacterium]NBJ81695.1 tRNA adenosine(34) deaminase TadA [bacterium 1XD42-76]NBK05139.1 tRNA adenosine(34) deaminase TadA [bacterium 1XD42-94]
MRAFYEFPAVYRKQQTAFCLYRKGMESKMTQEEKYMREAIRQARKAEALREVPIGCIIVFDGKIIGRGYNRRTVDKNVLAHAELTAIRKACKKIGDWRLEGCTMYVTLEPCPMCAGAIVQARIPRVVIGCMNPKAGCAGSVLDLFHEPGFNHQVEMETGLLGEECSQLLKKFFKELREEGRKKKQQRSGSSEEREEKDA